MNGDLLSGIGQFFQELFQDLTNGLILFGGPLDIGIAIVDVLITTLVIYYILRLLRDSRAWQLLKGLILIIAFALAGSLAGLTTLGFILNNTISVLAIAFVIIFQPELRRALETVGRSSLIVLAGSETGAKEGVVQNMIESIVRACEQMSAAHTGALIIIERETRLTELLEQENVVTLDSAISSTILQQIFYTGSPLHDGAALIRGGRIAGARIHVPLSDNYHLRRDYGTRHRAAVGASEIGDAIAIVVSEERGTISIAIEGRLFVLDNADALRTLLHKILNPTRPAKGWSSLFRGRRADRAVAVAALREKPATAKTGDSGPAKTESGSKEAVKTDSKADVRPDSAEKATEGAAPETQAKPAAAESGPGQQRAAAAASSTPSISEIAKSRTPRSRSALLIEDPKSAVRSRPPRHQRILLIIFSFAIALVLFLYVQVTINPVDSRTFTTTLSYENIEIAESKGFEVQVPIESVQVTLMGRQNTIVDLRSEDVTAYIDFSEVNSTGILQLPVQVRVARLAHLRPTDISPMRITISIRSNQ